MNALELVTHLEILKAFSLRSLKISTSAGIIEDAWAELAQFVGLQSLDIWTARAQTPLSCDWARNLQSSLESISLGAVCRGERELSCR